MATTKNQSFGTITASISQSQNGHGLDDVHKFQLYFAERATSLVVYAFGTFGKGKDPLYDGSKLVQEIAGKIDYTLYFLYYEQARHYQPILNLVGASGCRGFCVKCHKAFKNIENHMCKYKCIKCFQIPSCISSNNVVKCTECCREFFGDDCFRNHLKEKSFNQKISVCEKIKICKTCCKVVRVENRKFTHECGKAYCRVCRTLAPLGHLCYMQPILVTEVSAPIDAEIINLSSEEKKKDLYVFYDFETQQSQSVVGDDNAKVHVVNLCVAHKICTYCFDEKDINVRCSKCGIREFVFNKEPVKQLIDLIWDFRRSCTKIVCIAHNSSGFDANFILKYLIEKYGERTKPSVILNGCKIISMEINNIKFIDSLLYFHMPLSGLPKAYGLPDVSKGTFCHLFNTPEN